MKKCKICRHPDKKQIEQFIVEQVPNTHIAKRYAGDFSEHAIRSHKKTCMPIKLAVAERKNLIEAADVWDQLRTINNVTLNIVKEARYASDHDMTLKAIARVEKQAELIMKLLGELDESPKVNVAVVQNPIWLDMRSVIIEALAEHPEARASVAAALQQFEN